MMQATEQNTRLGFADVRTAAAGQWEFIHKRLGVNLPNINHRKHSACPGCGGRDRFRLLPDYPESGRWLCGGGGDFQRGDGFALLEHVFGWSGAEQLQAVADVLGLGQEVSEAKRAELRKQAEAHALKIAAATKLKDERHRYDSNVMDALEDLEGLIRQRNFLQRKTHTFVEPFHEEVATARVLNAALLESYAGRNSP